MGHILRRVSLTGSYYRRFCSSGSYSSQSRRSSGSYSSTGHILRRGSRTRSYYRRFCSSWSSRSSGSTVDPPWIIHRGSTEDSPWIRRGSSTVDGGDFRHVFSPTKKQPAFIKNKEKNGAVPKYLPKTTPRKHFLETPSGSSYRKQLTRAFPRNIFGAHLPVPLLGNSPGNIFRGATFQ